MLAPFSPAFLSGEARALSLLPDDFRREAARASHVRRAAERRVAPQTLAALEAQAAPFPSPARTEHLRALGQAGTVAVVTGQQVGLFLGPLYAVYKAASAVAVARALQAQTGRRCVPVFWLQTEDHDLAEINHCHLLGDEGLVHRLELPGEGARRSVGGLQLGEGVLAQLDALAAHLAAQPHLGEVLALLRPHYRPEATWGQAFAGVLSALFAHEGLVLVDPRDAQLAQQLRPVHARALREAGPLSALLQERTAQLEAAGFAAQVHVKPGAPLSFFHPEGPLGPRVRLEPGSAPDGEDLSFSTSALLRPIAQDTLLPTAAIVGGPGELNYFAQLPPLYEAFGLPMPMLVPRARFRVLEGRTRTLLTRLGLTAAQLEAPRAQVLQRLLPPQALTPEALERRLTEAVAPLLAEVPVDDADVADAVARTRGTVARAFSRLSARYGRSLQQRDAALGRRVDRLQAALFPEGEPQERVLCFPSVAARLGVRELMALVYANLDPFSADVKELLA